MSVDESAIIENLKVICLCKGIKKGAIVNAVKQGHDTVKKINKRLGTGSGYCEGERCRERIQEIIDECGR